MHLSYEFYQLAVNDSMVPPGANHTNWIRANSVREFCVDNERFADVG